MKKRKFREKDVIGWCLMVPSLCLFLFFIWEPMFESIRLSLYSTIRYETVDFIGLDNYVRVIRNPDFLAALRNTFMYTIWSLIIGFATPIILAIIISETTLGKSTFRAAVYFPNIVPGIATIWIWNFFFLPGDNGVLNILLGKLGLGSSVWLNNVKWTIPLIIVIATWKAAGSTALVYMANITSIPPELYEASAIDGASVWKRIRYITLPSIGGVAKTMLILQFIGVFQIFYEPMILKNGGPNNASISLMMMQYRYAFRDFDFGAGAALSVIVGVILIALSVVYFAVTADKKKDGGK